MGTAARTVMGVVALVAVWLALATTLFSGTGPVEPPAGPRACATGSAPPDVRLLSAGTVAACPDPTP